MNEKDIIHTIENKTKDLPIPDSISPEAMKKMLDEHKNDTQNNTTDKTSAGNHNHIPADLAEAVSATTKRNRYIRRFTAAACVVLCLAGSIGVSKLLTKQEDFVSETAMDAGTTDSAEDAENEETTEEFSDDLAYQSGLSSPDSYDEYYDTLKSAYDEYYDRISSVQTRNGDVEIMEETADAVGAVESATEAEMLDEASMKFSADSTKGVSAEKESGNSSGKNYSTTNTQEKTVDEGDIIKTDGTYIYKVVQGFDNDTGDYFANLTITKTDKGDLDFITSINLDNVLKDSKTESVNFEEFYLYDDKLFLLYTKNNSDTDSSVGKGELTESCVVIYDLKDKANPKEVKQLSQSGWYVSSRISDGYLYTISNFNDTSIQTKKPYSNYIPTINGKTIECENIYYPENVFMETTYVITSLDLSNPKKFTDSKAVPTKAGETYVSDSSIYIYTTIYENVTKTEIMKISYAKGKLTPGNSATVAGSLYDSFALSEYDGHLRIVATIPANNITLLRKFGAKEGAISEDHTVNSDDVTITENINALYILDSNMELTGKLTGLAPGEQIYSARFMGDIGYFVTFRNTDPLFSVDLSDPANPEIIGELKIPGFSNYLHFYDDNLLLGIGEEIDESTQMFKGLKLSMFDISNPADVTEEDKYIIEKSQFSEALSNHKAIMIDPEKNLFGFLYGGYDSNYNDYYYYATYTYDKEKGFIETGKYLINDGSEYEYNSVRGVYIGDYLYITTNRTITSYKLGTQDPVAQIYFQ